MRKSALPYLLLRWLPETLSRPMPQNRKASSAPQFLSRAGCHAKIARPLTNEKGGLENVIQPAFEHRNVLRKPSFFVSAPARPTFSLQCPHRGTSIFKRPEKPQNRTNTSIQIILPQPCLQSRRSGFPRPDSMYIRSFPPADRCRKQ